MVRQVKVAAVQLTGPPSSIPSVQAILDYRWEDEEKKLTGVKAINWTFANGNEQQCVEAKRLLSQLDVGALKEHFEARIIHFIGEAAEEKCDVVVFPELALTGFFPLFYIEDEEVLNSFFERNPLHSQGHVQRIIKEAEDKNISVCFGFGEINDRDEHYNVLLLFDNATKKSHIYRKTHLPGFKVLEKGKESFQFEYGQFKPSQEGYPVVDALGGRVGMTICHDRRYSAPYLCMGQKKVELILNGYNSAAGLVYASGEGLRDPQAHYDLHYLPQQGQAITEGTYIVSVGLAGNNFGSSQIAGTCIISPYGHLLAKSEEIKEEMLIQTLDLDVCSEVRELKHNGERSEPQVLVCELNKIMGFQRFFSPVGKEIAQRGGDKGIKEMADGIKETLDEKQIHLLIQHLQQKK